MSITIPVLLLLGYINLISCFLDLLTAFFWDFEKKIKNHKHVTTMQTWSRSIPDVQQCTDRGNFQISSVASSQEKSFSCFTVGEGYYHSLILPRLNVLEEFCMSWLSKHRSMANFNDIHNLLMRFIPCFFFVYLPTLSQPSICQRNMKLDVALIEILCPHDRCPY